MLPAPSAGSALRTRPDVFVKAPGWDANSGYCMQRYDPEGEALSNACYTDEITYCGAEARVAHRYRPVALG